VLAHRPIVTVRKGNDAFHDAKLVQRHWRPWPVLLKMELDSVPRECGRDVPQMVSAPSSLILPVMPQYKANPSQQIDEYAAGQRC
jgi:hypothetical protein